MRNKWVRGVLSAIPLGIGVGTIGMVFQGHIEASNPITFLSIGMICLAALHYGDNNEKSD